MKKNRPIIILNIIAVMIGLFSCSTIPKGVQAVTPFDKEKYLGKWYEIARFDFKYERNLNNTSAEYSLNSDGTIRVENRGYDTIKRVWKKAIGKAKFVGNDDIAMLKVSFFGPFYAGYNVIALDADYKYALVSGASLNYLWILSREKTIPDEIKKKYLKIAEGYGYPIAELSWIVHDQSN
ncbi:lipocalin family protein [Parabacteroides sp. FAFU027]|uniref:lipocalin family protein n=1 Tax=Parabacteroides sp. FAFU027 TaxID=2922715 RepID=UPI001FAF7ACF|nr:lipocalin family protein [Parabacteroides sp. FAFU027]